MGQITVEYSPPLAAGALEDVRGQLGRAWEVAERTGVGIKPDRACCVSPVVRGSTVQYNFL